MPVGRPATCAFDWDHQPVAPALQITKSDGAAADQEDRMVSAIGEAWDSQDVYNLITSSTAGPRGAVAYQVRNGTDVDIYLGVWVPETSSQTYKKAVRRTSASLGPIENEFTALSAGCAAFTNGKFRINTAGGQQGTSTINCSGTGGWVTPIPGTVTTSPAGASAGTAGGAPLTTAPLIADVDMFGADGVAIGRCTTNGCAPQIVAPNPDAGFTGTYTFWEFRIPRRAAANSPTTSYILLNLGGLGALSPSTPASAVAHTQLDGGAFYAAQLLDEWGWCHHGLGNAPNNFCEDEQQERLKDYRSLSWARIDLDNLRAAIRTRPANQAAASGTTAASIRPPNLRDDTGSLLNFPTWTWRACQGTWNLNTCVDTLPRCDGC